MKAILSMSLLWLSLAGCLPANVCDVGQVQDEGALCVPIPMDAGSDGGVASDGGPDGGATDGG